MTVSWGATQPGSPNGTLVSVAAVAQEAALPLSDLWHEAQLNPDPSG